MTAATPGRVRAWVGPAAVLTIGVGLLGRFLPVVGNAVGGIAYTVLVALLVVLVMPAVRPVVAAAVGLGVSIAVELLQLTPIPGFLTGMLPPLRWVLGSTFLWVDLLWYAVGAVVAYALLTGIQRRSGRGPHTMSR